MNRFKKSLSVLLALVMVFGLVVPNLTSKSNAEANFTQTLRVHKVLQKDNFKRLGEGENDSTNPTKNYLRDGIEDLKGGEKIKGVNFKLYKATGSAPDLTHESDVVIEGTTGSDGYVDLELKNVEAGDYVLVEDHAASTYKGPNGEVLTKMMAVPVRLTLPLRDNKSVMPTANLYPKNIADKPNVTKTSSKVTDGKAGDVKIGDEVPFKVSTTIPAGSNLKTASWTDTMSKGLTLKSDSVKVTGLEDNEYTIDKKDHSYVLTLNEEGLKKVNGKDAPVVITITYSAVVNKDAVADSPEPNQLVFQYGNAPGYTPEPGDKTPPPTKPKNGEIEVKKTWGQDGSEDIPAGVTAKFKLQVWDAAEKVWKDAGKELSLTKDKKSDKFTGLSDEKVYKVVEVSVTGYEGNTVANYTISADGQVTVKNKPNNNPPPVTPPPVTVVPGGKKFEKVDATAEATKLEGAKFYVKDSSGNYLYKVKETGAFEFIEGKEAAGQDKELVVLTSGDQGKFEISGLAYGTYKIEEFEAPDGYVVPANAETEFEVKAGSYEGTAAQVLAVPNSKTEIPHTGGIGSAIFIAAGLALMGFAVVTIKRRREDV